MNPSEVTWEASAGATPGDALTSTDGTNNFTPVSTATLSNIKINEVNMNGGVHGDWIELYDTLRPARRR